MKIGDVETEIEIRAETIGKFLKQGRLKAGLTQLEVSRNFKYSNLQFVSNWERGISLPPIELLPKLAKLYNISAEDLIEVVHHYQDRIIEHQKQQFTALFQVNK